MRVVKGRDFIFAGILLMLLGTCMGGLMGCAHSSAGAFHETITSTDPVTGAESTRDTIKFQPKASTFWAKIEEAKQDAIIEMEDPDGFKYRMASGSQATGMDSTASVEMISGIVSGVMMALPELAPFFVQGMEANANKPVGPSDLEGWADILRELRELRLTLTPPIAPSGEPSP